MSRSTVMFTTLAILTTAAASGSHAAESGTLSGATLTESDARLKTNVQTMPVGLDKILQLEPVTFYWKNPHSDRLKHYGLIAQQVRPVIPELVQESLTDEGYEHKDILLLNYQELIPILISAVQDLKNENDHLQVQLDSLSRRLESGQ